MKSDKNDSKDSLGDRMKRYESITSTYLLPRSYVFCRIDGRAFHTYLRNCKRPFDPGVIADMDATAIYLCENVQNAKLGYVQSDEITLLLCDFESRDTSQFFDGNIQKISSIVASMATARFNQLRFTRYTSEAKSPLWELPNVALATFDCRCWVVPSQWEAANVFIWRNQDCSRNSLSMVAQANFSHKELQGANSTEMHEMLHAKGVNWATDFPDGDKNGRLIVKEEYIVKAGEAEGNEYASLTDVKRSRWVSKGAWKFTEDKERLLNMIPTYE
jgi:tRNA(His) guanylyltransferase